jgi:hypothetical protein
MAKKTLAIAISNLHDVGTLSFKTSGGTSDVDMYVRYGNRAILVQYDFCTYK